MPESTSRAPLVPVMGCVRTNDPVACKVPPLRVMAPLAPRSPKLRLLLAVTTPLLMVSALNAFTPARSQVP